MDFFNVNISPKSIALADSVLHSGWINQGKITRELESELARRGLHAPVLVNSGTSALHLALESAIRLIKKANPNVDTFPIVLPAQTFIATGLAVKYIKGAFPIFADIDLKTGTISVDFVKEIMRWCNNIAVVVAVHWGGFSADVEGLNDLGLDFAIVEDAAQALGATYKGRPVGSCTYTDYACFSFQSIKTVTMGDGGAVCSWEPSHINNLRWFGIDKEEKVGFLGEREGDVSEIGYKYNPNDISAAIGLGNLYDLDTRIFRRREIANIYRKELNLEGITLLDNMEGSSCWLFDMLVEDRDKFITEMRAQDIPVSVVHQGIDRYSVMGGYREDLLNQRVWDAKHICLPMHEGLTDDDVQKVIKAVRSGW